MDLLPGLAPVGGFIEPAARPAADYLPGLSDMFPHGGIEHLRVVYIHGQVAATGEFIDKKDVFPGLSPVLGFVDAPFPGGAVQGALGGHPYPVRIFRVDDDPRNMPREFQPQVLPGLPAIYGFVDPVPIGGHHPPGGVFPHADIDHVRVALRNRNGPD